MDSALVTVIETLVSNIWTWLYSGNSTAVYGAGNTSGFQAAAFLGYGGSAIAFFFSLYGAYTTGAKLVSSTEAGFFAFLEDF